jgi:hypothetical protein
MDVGHNLYSIGIFVLCRLSNRPSLTCCPVGGQAIWPVDMTHTRSKEKTVINDWDTVCGNFRYQVQ